MVVWRGSGGRALVLSFSQETGGEAGSWCVTRKWCARSSGRSTEGRRKDHPEVVRWLGSRRRPPSWRSAVSVLLLRRPGLALCGDARAPKSFVRSLLPPASCLLPRRRGWLAVSVETRKHQSLALFDLPSPARLACWRAVTRKCARRSEMKGGSVDRCIEASQ